MDLLEKYATAIFQNANVGLQSINDILPKVKDKALQKELKNELNEYKKITKALHDFANSNNICLQENNFFEKAKMWLSINFSTLTDTSTRHITELLLLGSVMGITTCYKDKFDHKGVSEDLDDILLALETIEEENYKQLKSFLKENLA